MLLPPTTQDLAALRKLEAIPPLLTVASAAARMQLSDEQIEALSALLESELLDRQSKAQNQRLKLAKLGQRAHPSDVDLRTARQLSKATWQRLMSLNWLKQHQHLLFIGPTGIGKSYLACALAKVAIDQKYSVRYLRMPRLQEELALVRAQGKLSLWLKSLSRIPLLILDDFGLIPMSQNDQPLLLELVEDRYQSGSLIINSQLPTKLWHDQFVDKTLADAIMDRIVHNAEKIELKGESMRKNPVQTG